MNSMISTLISIAATIPTTINQDVSTLGYLDCAVEPTASVMKGVDEHGRVFVTLIMKSTWTGPDNVWKKPDGAGIITIFQRYTNPDEDTVTEAHNSGFCPAHLLSGAATDADMRRLRELVETGKTTVSWRIGRTPADGQQWELSLISVEEWKQEQAKLAAA